MKKARLFLLRPSFADPKTGNALYHCPHSARIEGLLSFFPFLRTELDVSYVPFARPRTEIVNLLGVEHQSSPVLVFKDAETANLECVRLSSSGYYFVLGAEDISNYLAAVFAIPWPHP